MAETYFKKIFKGYDPQQVNAFIVSLSDKYEENEKEFAEQLKGLKAENARLLAEIAELRQEAENTEKEHEGVIAEKQKEYDNLYVDIGQRMVVADQRAEQIVNTAQAEADRLAEEVRLNAELEAKAIRKRAEEEAAQIIAETKKKCESLSAAAEEFRMRQYEMSRSMSETEKQFESALDKLRAEISEQE